MPQLNKISLFIFSLLLCACTSNEVKTSSIASTDDFSGYLGDYSGLTTKELSTGTKVLRWQHPQLKQGLYKKLMIEPVSFYPEPQVQDQVGKETLAEVSRYMSILLVRLAKQNGIELTKKPGPDVLRLRSAFTAVDIKSEGLSIRDIIPIRMIITGVTLATGKQDLNVTMLFEAELRDSRSHQVMLKAIRKGNALQLENRDEQLSLEHIKPLIDSWGLDINDSFATFSKVLQ